MFLRAGTGPGVKNIRHVICRFCISAIDLFCDEMTVEYEKILFQKDLDIWVDKFKRFKLLLLDMEKSQMWASAYLSGWICIEIAYSVSAQAF